MSNFKRNLIMVAASIIPVPALAHHPLAGAPMETFTHGILSGIGHPILGFDHLFFIALVGLAALYTGAQYKAPLAYIGAMVAGCLLMSFGIALPLAEVIIGLSLLVLGAVVLSGKVLTLNWAMTGFAVAGLFHGSAFGESIVGQEAGFGMAVLLGYLIGLTAAQYAIAIGFGLFAKTVWNANEATAIHTRIAGAIVAGIGLFLTLENAEGFMFSALGLAT